VTEDIKWGHDLCFSVAGKMFTVLDLERPHPVAFKCTPESFGELTARSGIIPAPYMARNMWVMEQELGEALDQRELEALVRTSYELVVAALPKSRRPGASSAAASSSRRPRTAAAKRKAAPRNKTAHRTTARNTAPRRRRAGARKRRSG
jgi:predicted DNA-binding protein (MmcQ/YjbR family)